MASYGLSVHFELLINHDRYVNKETVGVLKLNKGKKLKKSSVQVMRKKNKNVKN